MITELRIVRNNLIVFLSSSSSLPTSFIIAVGGCTFSYLSLTSRNGVLYWMFHILCISLTPPSQHALHHPEWVVECIYSLEILLLLSSMEISTTMQHQSSCVLSTAPSLSHALQMVSDILLWKNQNVHHLHDNIHSTPISSFGSAKLPVLRKTIFASSSLLLSRKSHGRDLRGIAQISLWQHSSLCLYLRSRKQGNVSVQHTPLPMDRYLHFCTSKTPSKSTVLTALQSTVSTFNEQFELNNRFLASSPPSKAPLKQIPLSMIRNIPFLSSHTIGVDASKHFLSITEYSTHYQTE